MNDNRVSSSEQSDSDVDSDDTSNWKAEILNTQKQLKLLATSKIMNLSDL